MPEREPSLRSEHAVVFYEEQPELINAVTDFVANGGPDAVALVIATPVHRQALAGLLPPETRFVDAASLLNLFCDDGVLDGEAFANEVGDLLRVAGDESRPLRVFAEMVALLWEKGLVTQAIELEGLWTTLAETIPFALLSAYPSTLVLDSDDPHAVNRVCETHKTVRERDSQVRVRAFTSSARSITEARRFVASVLEGCAGDHVDKALLIVSELATNAVQHARTPFVVEVARREHGSCVSVRDRSRTEVGHSAAPMDSESGRGLGVVDALSDEWGVKFTRHGKIVWAEVG